MSRFTPLARALALSALALSGVVAAFATIVPEVPAPPLEAARIDPVALRPVLLAPSPASFQREERFQPGDTLASLFGRLGVAEADARRLVRVPALRLLRPGVVVAAEVGAEGELLRLRFLSGRTLAAVERAGAELRSMEGAAPLRAELLMRSGVIRSSLFAAADAAAVPDAVAMQMADIFAGDVDFHRELRPGDRFAVVYEQYYLDGRPVHAGRVLAAEFVNQGRTLRALHYAPAPGQGGGYYAPDGSNLRKAFLRSPLEYSRISSGFGMRRHPFQQTWRAHTGVDFAAPTGTRVRAAGDGVVEFAGPKAGYGNMVVLRHRGSYSTVYAHLSRFAPGLPRGTRVAQGDVIGFVGQTGWATGPHLHYEFRIAGQSRNPYAIAMPAGEPVAAAELAAYRRHAEPLLARLDLLGNNPIALRE